MDRRQRIADELRVEPGTKANLAGRYTRWTGGGEYDQLSTDEARLHRQIRPRPGHRATEGGAGAAVGEQVLRPVRSCSRRWTPPARTRRSSTSCRGVNPQGVDVASFRHPSGEELAHPFLWRIVAGRAGQRAASGSSTARHYEEVRRPPGAPRVARRQDSPTGAPMTELWASRYADINAFEQHLDHTGVTTVKFFLNVSKEEQKRRFLRRLDRPHKEWKFSAEDVPSGNAGTTTQRRSSTPSAPPPPRGRPGT